MSESGHSGDWGVSGVQRQADCNAGRDGVLVKHGMSAGMGHFENTDGWFKWNTLGGAEKGWAT